MINSLRMRIAFTILWLLLGWGTVHAQISYNVAAFTNAGNPGGTTFAETTTTGWVDAGIAGSISANVWSPSITLPFAFNFFGTPVTACKASANGLLTFTTSVTGTPPNANGPLPHASLPDNTIAVMWDEFTNTAPTGSNDKVYTFTLGTAPNRQFWVYWFSFEYGNPSVSFLYFGAVLEETTNNVYVVDVYDTSSPLLTSTVGVQLNATTAIMAGSNIAQAANSTTNSDNDYWRFSPFLLVNDNAGITGITSPVAPFSAGSLPVNVTMKNFGGNAITGANVNWMLNGVPQTGTSFSGSLAAQATTTVSLGNGTFVAGNNTLKAWTALPNGVADSETINDTLTTTLCTGLSGAYTIGAAGNYTSIAAAIGDLTNCGVSGPVTFAIDAGTYAGAISIPAIPGASAANTVTFRGAGTGSTILTYNGAGTPNATLTFNGADYVTFKKVTIANTEASSEGWGVLLTNQANYNTIDSCIINVDAVSTSSSFMGVLASGSTTSNSAIGNNANYTTISNTTINGGYYGVCFYGNTSANADNTNNKVENCTISGAYYYGIYGIYQDGMIATHNTISFRAAATSGYGISLTTSRHSNIQRNTVNSAKTYGIYFSGENAAASGATMRSVVANNMVKASGSGDGIYLTGALNIDIFYNTFSSETDQALYASSSSTGYDIRNNIFSATGGTEIIDIDAAPTTEVIDYNVYYKAGTVTNLAAIGSTNYLDLAAWQTGDAARNTASLSGDPGFVGTTLYLQGSLANNMATPIAGFTTDIDGDTRSATTPDMGADEYTPPSCFAPSALTATGVTTTGATLGWTPIGTETAWDVEYGVSGFVQGSGTMAATSTASYAATGLSANTTYQFYVRANCGTSTSTWAGPFSFYTGYCQFSSTNSGSYFNAFTTTGGATNISNTGSGYAAGGYQNATAMVVSQYATGSVNFTTTLVGTTVGVSIWIDWNNNLVFDVSERVYNTGAYVSAASGTITVPAGTPIGSYRMRAVMDFNATSPNACSAASGRAEAEDYTFAVIALPSCVPPSTLTATNISATGASLGWTENGTATAWDIEYGTTGFTQGTGTTITGTTTKPYALTGLTFSTTYQFYVRANCGSITSVWAGPFSFFTGYCTPAPSSVDGTGITNVSTGTINNTTGAEAGNYGNYTAQVVTAPAGVPLGISITYATGYTYNTFAWIDWNDDLDFLDANEAQYLGESTNANPTTFAATITVPAAAPLGNHRLRIGGADVGLGTTTPSDPCYTGAYGTFEDYTINVITPPACLPVGTLSVSGITNAGAMLGWTVNGTETAWDIEYGTTGFTQGSGTTVAASTNPYTITGLSANTTYQFYVRANCGGGTSTWAGPFSFTTLCNPYTVPYFEGFEAGYTHNTTVAGCLSQASVAGTQVWTANNTLTDYNRTPRTGGWNAFLRYGNEDWLFIPLTLTGGTSYTVDLYARQDYATAIDANMAISYGTTNTAAGMTNAIVAATGIVSGNYQQITGVFTPATTGTYYVGIKGYMSGNPWYISLDDISVTETPACAPPSGLSATNVTMTSAMFDWTENGTATAWDIEYGTAGFTQGTGTLVTATTTKPYSVTGLTFNNNYQFYVRANCGGSTSPWVGPFGFSTSYCTPAPASVDGSGITNVTIGSINNTTVAEAGNYGNYSAQVSPAPQGGSLAVSITLATGYTYDMWAWVDWNNDLDFTDANEANFLGTSSANNPTTFTATLSIPAGAATGNHRLRIGGADSGLGTTAPSDPCYTGSWAAFEDYTLNVVTCTLAASATQTNVACNGGTTGAIDLTVTGAATSATVLWSNSAATEDLTGLAAGTYSVTVTDANFCVATGSYTLTEPTAISIALDSTDNATCFGATNGAVYVTASGGTGALSSVWSNTATSDDLSGVGAGAYTVTVTDANSCSVTSAAFTVTEPTALTAIVDSTDNVLCNGDSTGAAYTTTTGGTGAYSYSWSNGDLTDDISVLVAGTYTLTVTDANGCTGTTTATITEPTAIAVTADSIFNNACNGDSLGAIYLTVAGGTPSYSYSWSNGETGDDIDSLAAGSYTGTITDANGCVFVAQIDITEPLPLTIAVDSTADVNCFGGNDGAIAISVAGGTQGVADTLITPLAPNNSNGGAIFDVTVTNTISLKTFVVNVSPAAGTAYDAFLFYRSGTYVGNQSNSAGWTAVPLVSAVSGGPTGFTFVDLAAPLTLPAGTYGMYVGGYNGSMAYTNGTTVGAAWAADANVAILQGQGRGLAAAGTEFGVSTTSGTRCFTGAFLYEVPVAPVYNWSNSAVTEDITGLTAGAYTVTVTDVNGCTATNTTTVAEPTALTNVLDSVDNVSCFGLTDGGIYITPSGGVAPYGFAWSNGDTTEDITGLAAGSYTGTITDAHGCTLTSSAITVTEPTALTAAIQATDNACKEGTTGSVAVTPAGGTAGYTIAWNTGATGSPLANVGAGSYSATITDANGCTALAQATVANTDSLPTATGSGAITGSGEVTFTNESSANATAFSWNFGDNTGTSSDAAPKYVYAANGTYAVQLIATGACGSDTFTFEVTVGNVGIREDLSSSLSLYPNPTEGTFSLAFAGAGLSDAEVQIYSMDGKLVATEMLGVVSGSDVRTITLDRSVVASGVYTLRVASAEGVMVKRLVIR